MHRRRLFLAGVLFGCAMTALVTLAAQRFHATAEPVVTSGPVLTGWDQLLTLPENDVVVPEGKGSTPVEPPRLDGNPPRSFNGTPYRIVPLAVAAR